MGHGAWADYVRGGCDCFLWHYKRQQNSHESPIHCTHSCAVMVKLAYMVEQDPWLLGELHGFYAPSTYVAAAPPGPPPMPMASTRLNLAETTDEDSEEEIPSPPEKKPKIEPGTSPDNPIDFSL